MRDQGLLKIRLFGLHIVHQGAFMVNKAFDLQRPMVRNTSVVFASPHSGRNYPADFLKRSLLDEHQVRSSEDAYVNELFGAVPSMGAPLLSAKAPRAFLDLNRAPEELDPALIEGVRRISHNARVASGLGVIPRVVSNGRSIYSGKISLAEAHGRLSNYWRPYHDMLQTLLDESQNSFGEAILIDCHSMPHEALENVGPPGSARPDIVLGDRFGAAASSDVVDQIEAAFTNAGFRVARNMPFAGAYIAQHYGRPSRRQHAVQVEIDRALYMNERTLQRHDQFESFKARIDGVVAELVEIGRVEAEKVAAE